MRKQLAILGGMGSSAGVRLAQHLVHCAQKRGALHDWDFPEFMLYNLPLRGMDETGIIDAGPVKRQLHEAFNRLNGWRCDYALVACNTVHCFYPDMVSWFNGTVLNLVEIACDRSIGVNHYTGKVGLVCSSTLRKTGLYQEALHKRKAEPLLVYEDEQDQLGQAIGAAISGTIHMHHRLPIQDMIRGLASRGACAVIIGCSELPLVCDYAESEVPLIDAGAVAVEHAFELLK